MGIRGKAISRVGIIYKFASRRDLPLSMRDTYGINSLDRTKLKQIALALISVKQIRQVCRKKLRITRRLKRIQRLLIRLAAEVLQVGNNVQNIRRKSTKPKLPRKRIIDFENCEEIESFSEIFRFQNGNQLRSLLNGFQLPRGKIRIKSYQFESEEIRLSYPMRWSDVRKQFPDRSRNELQVAFYWFLDFMILNW